MRFASALHTLSCSTLAALVAGAVLLAGSASPSHAQTAAEAQPPARILGAVDASSRSALENSVSPRIHLQGAVDQGRAAANFPLEGMTLVFAQSPAQMADLKQLLVAQQTQGSPSYHQWLTTAQFAARFGMNDADIASAENWLRSEGFTVAGVSNARTSITFNGTTGQVEAAFATEMHHYSVGGETHLANATALQVPSALAGVVAGVRNVTDFRVKSYHHAAQRPAGSGRLKAQYTDSQAYHDLAPADIVTIYDIQALYSAGYSGAGQKIAIMGQSAINMDDLTAFRTAAGLPAIQLTQVLVPNTGSSTVVSGDEGESDLDLEWSGAMAPNASIYFVYTGADTNVDVTDALLYAVDNQTAPILSISYGGCEPDSQSFAITYDPTLMEANAQGQTVIASSGDTGATGCDDGENANGMPITSATQGLAVNYPASSAYVTGMGGTEFNDAASESTYWSTSNTAAGGSALSYIPEIAWNDTAESDAGSPAGGLSSTGGGKSILFGKPSWQVATGVPSDAARDVPDISLDASNGNDAYLVCTEDGFTGGSCSAFSYEGTSYSAGFDAADATGSLFGGTSFSAPIFAGMLALINEKNAVTAGVGNINPTLYSLYATAPTAFHDITLGNNEQPCTSGSVDCPAGTTEIGYVTGAGYDLVTGLGTIDVNLLATAFPPPTTTTSTTPAATTTTLTAPGSAIVTGTAINFSAAVTSTSGTTVPTGGTVQFAVDGTPQGSGVALSSTGLAPFTYTFTAAGSHTITATYSGTASFATSVATLGVTVAAPATGSFTLSATNVTVVSGQSATTTVTITSTSGYSGIVGFKFSPSATFTGCLFGTTATAKANGTVTTTLTVDTLVSDCVSTGSRHKLLKTGDVKTASLGSGRQGPLGTPLSNREYPIAAAALLAGLALLRGRRKGWPLMMVLLLATLGTALAVSGCGGSSGTPVVGTTTTGTTPGTYTITVVGTDSTVSTITASTTFTVTVQ